MCEEQLCWCLEIEKSVRAENTCMNESKHCFYSINSLHFHWYWKVCKQINKDQGLGNLSAFINSKKCLFSMKPSEAKLTGKKMKTRVDCARKKEVGKYAKGT